MLCLVNMMAFFMFYYQNTNTGTFCFHKELSIKGKTSWDEGLISDENKTQVSDAVNSVKFVVIFVR